MHLPPGRNPWIHISIARSFEYLLKAVVQPRLGTEAATEVPAPFAPLSLCNQTGCKTDFNCYPACGGFGNAYCERGRCNFL